MARTVPAAFEEFFSNINLSGDHRDTSNARRDDIVAKLKNSFTILKSMSTGSIPRYTALRAYADLDVMVVLHYGKHIGDKRPSQVLQDVRNALAKYKTGARKNGQAVTLYYSTWPNVDIVPVYKVERDNALLHYCVPDMNREVWVASRPDIHSKNIQDRASSYGTEFRRIIKMLKHWNRKHGSYLQSYHVEVLALAILIDSFSNHSWAVFSYFDKACGLVQGSLSYLGSDVSEYLSNSDRQEALARLKSARDKARVAWYQTYGANDNHERGIGLWRQLFGDEFPSYG